MSGIYAILLGGLAFTSAAAAAQTPPSASVSSKPITVQAGGRSMQLWAADVSRRLQDNMIYPSWPKVSDIDEGAVRVRFRASETGQPTDLVLAQSSHHSAIDRAALFAVNHIDTLYPLPDGVTPGRPMEAWLVFATDQQSSDRMMRQLKRKQAQVASAAGSESADALLAASVAPIVFMAR